MLSVPGVHLDDGGLVTIGIGVRGRAVECLSPVSGESLDMLGVEAVAERMGDHVRRPSPDGARRGQDGARRRFHPPPRRPFACIHDDNPSVSMQGQRVVIADRA